MDGSPGRSPAEQTLSRIARRLLVLPCLLVLVAPPAPVAGQDVSATPLATLELPAEVTALDFSSEGDRLLVGDADGRLRIRDLAAGSWLVEEEGDRAVAFASFVAGDTAFVRVDEAGGILVRGVREEGEPGLLRTGAAPVRVALDARRRTLAVATRDEEIELFDLPTRQRVGVIDGRGALDDLLYLGFDRLGRQLAAVSAGGGVTAWNPSTLEPLRRVTLQGSELYGSRSVLHAAGADRSANILVTALEEVALPRGGLRGPARPGDLERRDHLLVFDWYSGAEIRRMPAPAGEIEVLTVGPGNDHVVVARGEAVTIADLRRGERGAAITASAPVRRLAISAEHDRLGIASEGGQVAVWTLAYSAPTAQQLVDQAPDGIGGRYRVLGESSPAIAPETPVTMAVLPFDDRDGEGRMSRTVAELLTTQLANAEHLTLLERLRIDAIMDEHDLRREGITEEGGLQLGRLLNADYVLLGSIGTSGTTYTLSARLLRVETGEVVSGRQVLCDECRAPDLFEAIHLLGTTIAR